MTLPYSDPSNPALPSPLFSDITAARADHMRANNAAIFADLINLDGRLARVEDLEQTASSGGTLTLSVTNKAQQLITGTLDHTIVLPVVSTLYVGFTFLIMNSSTQSVTVNSSGSDLVATVLAGRAICVTCILITGTTAASWKVIELGGDVVGPASAVDGNFSVYDGVTGKLVKDAGFGLANWANGYIPKFRNGLVLSNNGSTGINIAPGAISDSKNKYILKLTTTPFYKVLQNSGDWSAGSGGNGLFQNAALDKGWYYAFLIRKDSDGTIDAGFSDSATNPSLPAGYTAFAYLGAFHNNSTDTTADISLFHQYGNRFMLDTVVCNAKNVTPASTNRLSVSVSTPPGLIGIYAFIVYPNNQTSVFAWIGSADRIDAAAWATNADLFTRTSAAMASLGGGCGGEFEVYNAAGTIYYRVSDNDCVIHILSKGWIDTNLPA